MYYNSMLNLVFDQETTKILRGSPKFWAFFDNIQKYSFIYLNLFFSPPLRNQTIPHRRQGPGHIDTKDLIRHHREAIHRCDTQRDSPSHFQPIHHLIPFKNALWSKPSARSPTRQDYIKNPHIMCVQWCAKPCVWTMTAKVSKLSLTKKDTWFRVGIPGRGQHSDFRTWSTDK